MEADSFNRKYGFVNVRLWRTSHAVLKVIAAMHGIQGIELMHKLIMEEAKRLGYDVIPTREEAPVQLVRSPSPVGDPVP